MDFAEESCRVETAFGLFELKADQGGLTSIHLLEAKPAEPEAAPATLPVLAEAARQLAEYFRGERRVFALQLSPKGTEFQRKVWVGLTQIPFGETISYKQLAERVGCPGGSRAVGMANNKNPLPIVVPCHRVVGADGKLVGFALGLDVKRRLLDLEGDVPPAERRWLRQSPSGMPSARVSETPVSV